MAKKNKKSTATSRAKKPSSTQREQSVTREQAVAKSPLRREIAAVICFILAAFSFIGYWNADGVFIGFFIGLIKGLIGYGYYAFPPALLFCSIILLFHRGRPVQLRILCILIMVVVIGSFFHLFIYDGENDLGFAMFGELWRSGTELSAGGVISGSITELFQWLFGFAGALIVLICASVALLLISINKTIVDIVDAYRQRERRQYAPEYEEEYDTTTGNAASIPASAPVRSHRHSWFAPKQRRKEIDIPVDGAPLSEQDLKREKDEYIKGENYEKSDNEALAQELPEPEPSREIEDLPLDIPFMEGPGRGRVSRMQRIVPELDSEKKPEVLPTTPPTVLSEKGIDKAKKPQNKKKDDGRKLIDLNINGVTNYAFPPLSLLSHGTPMSRAGDDEVRQNSERLEAAFQSFGVNVTISKATRGPAVTRYEAELEAGIKLSRLTGLADDIALSLGTIGVRIAAMPNKIATVGIEVPNKSISTVSLRDIIESKEFSEAKSKLTFAIGMDISGKSIVGDIAKLPHMLIAGTTGSGKSVCLNSIILSILYKSPPEDVRFIMIDPKMVEFKVYNDIPHLLVPVVTDVKKAAGALQWAVFEMMKRYALFAEQNARDLAGYNKVAEKSNGELEIKPQVVVVIDELADLMLTAAKEVEESICRIAQMGRAAGVHLVIATQSPRADVITGLMKANIPSRISFKVASALESRIILDAGGNADKLVGRGDMLFAPIGGAKPMRVQGTWVTDKEREKVVDYIKNDEESNYSDEVIQEIEKAAQGKSSGGNGGRDEQSGDDNDELLPQAVDVIFETGQASVSMLQRRLKLGYARAARIVDQMEQMGIVGPFEGSKPRTLLITKDQWRQMQYGTGVAPADSHFEDDEV